MSKTKPQPSAIAELGATPALRTPADELADAETINATVYRVLALGRAVQALADPDRDNEPAGSETLDGRLRALDELGTAIVEAVEAAMEPASELLLASRIRAEAVS